MQMNKKQDVVLLTIMLLGLSGCGMKGPLYFPQQEKSATALVAQQGGIKINQRDSVGNWRQLSMISRQR